MNPCPVLLPAVHHRWGINPTTGWYESNERALADMCDYGASRVAAGDCDFLAINCRPHEVEYVKDYMRKKHPAVGYAIGPGGKVLALAIDEWKKTRSEGE